MTMEKWRTEDLPKNEQAVLRQVYGMQVDENRGYAPNQIQYVRELTEQENSLFGQKTAISLACPLQQALYKLRGALTPLRFNRVVHDTVCREELFRLNYCSVGNRILAIVFRERNELPDMVYQNMEITDAEDLDSNLQKLMERDFRQEFDMRHGYLFRISVLRTGEEEFAIIVTAVQPLLELFDIRRIFREALGEPPQPAVSGRNLRTASTAEIEKSMRDYWSRLLADFPPMPRLPHMKEMPGTKSGQGRQESYLAYLPAYLVSDLREHAKSNKIMLMSILQTAWGILLQNCNHCTDIAFCLLVPTRQGRGAQDFGEQSMVPVRLQMAESSTVHEIVSKSFQQFLVSQPYASLGKNGIREILSQNGEAFDHFLNFYDFFTENKSYAATNASPEGALVSKNSRDVRDIGLGISFRCDGHRIAMTFSYDVSLFSSDGIRMLSEEYILTIQRMIADWTERAAPFTHRLEQRRAIMREGFRDGMDYSRKRVQNFLSRLPLLQECEEGIIQVFMKDARIFVRFEGDRIAEKEIEEQLVFVVEGKVYRSIETGDGWYNTLDILKENSWVNETVLLSNRRTHLAAEVLTDQATFLVIPLLSAQAILAKSPKFGQNIIQHTMRQMEKYQRLWVQS